MYVTGPHNRLFDFGQRRSPCDRLGNLSTRIETATGKVTEYAWDIHNRLTKVTYRASAGGAVTGTAEYAYDMNGRRMRRKVDIDGQAGFEIDERFVYARDEVALVFDAAGTLTNRYLSADAVDAALAEDDFSPSGIANATEWLLADHQGTVRDIVRETGAEITHVSYDSFGNITGVTGNVPVAPRIGYTGQERDPETGLLYYGARYYDPKTGRFISQDPTGYGAGDANLYRYVHNSPVIYVDPTGLRQQTPSNFLQSLLWDMPAIGSAANGLGSFTQQWYTPQSSSSSLQSVIGMGNRTLDFGAVPMPSLTGNLPAPMSMPDIHIDQLVGAWQKQDQYDRYVAEQQANGWSNWQAREWGEFTQKASNTATVATAPLDFLVGAATTAVGGVGYGTYAMARSIDNFQAAARSLLYDEQVTPYIDSGASSVFGQTAGSLLLAGVDFVTPGFGGKAGRAVDAAQTVQFVQAERRIVSQIDVFPSGMVSRFDDFKVSLNNDVVGDLRISTSAYPQLAENISHAQAAGHPSVLTHGGNAAANRQAALAGVPQVPGLSRDEYPFASSMEGGAGAWIGHIPRSQQNAQGALLKNFIQRTGMKPGDQYRVVVEP